jgi:hypothetical protein
MGYIITAPKCKDGKLKNGKTIVGDVTVEWTDGIVRMEKAEFAEVWPLVKKIPGYSFVEANDEGKPVNEKSTGDKDARDNSGSDDTLADRGLIDDITIVGEMVSIENTANEIKEFAAKQNPVIDLGKVKTKAEMIATIKSALKIA